VAAISSAASIALRSAGNRAEKNARLGTLRVGVERSLATGGSAIGLSATGLIWRIYAAEFGRERNHSRAQAWMDDDAYQHSVLEVRR
jgi:hypothetical protein